VSYCKFYDSDFNEIKLPQDELGYGLKGIDLHVSSISSEITERKSQGLSGSVVTGVRDDDRQLYLTAMIEAMNSTDFHLKRDRIYSFFSELDNFYITETEQGNKLIEVMAIDSYYAERPDKFQKVAYLNIPLKKVGQPYWISRFKTMDLHNNNGIYFNGNWSFGMNLDVDPSKLKYQFTNVNQFDFYNAGKQLKTIQEKGNCEIKIEFNQAVTNFSIEDAIGGKWKYNASKKSEWAIPAGAVLIFNGHDVRLNGTTIMERTNRYYPVINKGMNKWKVSGLSNYKITLDFRFKYY